MEDALIYAKATVKELRNDIKELNYKASDFEDDINNLKDEIDPPLYIPSKPLPDKSREQRKQEVMERIQQFNAAREEEQRQGITNSDPKVGDERKSLQFAKRLFKLDIEIK